VYELHSNGQQNPERRRLPLDVHYRNGDHALAAVVAAFPNSQAGGQTLIIDTSLGPFRVVGRGVGENVGFRAYRMAMKGERQRGSQSRADDYFAILAFGHRGSPQVVENKMYSGTWGARKTS
jgi:hypothetical protein